MAYFLAGGGVAASQQFGLTQTDVFAVNQNGQLTVSWVVGAGEWQGPLEIGPTRYAPVGCSVAASQQFGLPQTDVFLVNNSGQLAVYWVYEDRAWGGPGGIGPAGIAPPGACIAASQQIGLNQTDVFLFDHNGQLNVYWVDNAGAWQGPGKIGPQGIANPGGFLTASRQFGLNQTDVFFVDKNGQLNVCWVVGAGAWQGPGKIGPAGIAPPGACVAASQQIGLNQTDVFLIDKEGKLNVYWVLEAGAWGGPGGIGPAGIANPGSHVAASRQFGLNQTDVFFVDKNGQLNVSWVFEAGAWGGPGKIGPARLAPAGCNLCASQQIGLNQTDVFFMDASGQLNVSWVFEARAWGGPGVRGNPLPAPSAGLGSNSNYFLSNCSDIIGLSVTIDVTQDISGSDGFGFQVNCYSGSQDFDGAQQYLIFLSPTGSPQLTAMVDNWHTTSSQLINTQPKLASLPAHTLPAGYKLKISLANDANGNITGATYQAWDNHGNSIGSTTITLLSLSGVTQADLAPIVAFQLNFVDDLNGGKTVLSSGAGLISYSATSEMSVLDTEPSCVDFNFSTAETANSKYGPLSSSASHTFTQSFSYDPTGAVIRKMAKVMHVTKGI
ncbi:MAG TPA: hypothetical protein VGK22_16740 [Candidatus Angelobacter sp.]|jgi:hypothetical protein